MSVAVPSVHISARWSMDSARWPFPWTVRVILAHVGCLFSTHRTSVGVRQHTQDVRVCLSVHTGRPWLSVCVRQHTQDVRVCSSVHTGRPWLSVAVRVCPSAHTGRPWLSISKHISTLVLGLSTLTLLVDCSGDFGPRGLSVQYSQDVCGTHMTSVAVHQYTYLHAGPWTQHAGPFSWTIWEILAHVGCLFSTHRTSVGVLQHTQDVRGCPSAHTGRPCVSVCTQWTSVAVRVCPCVSISTHRTSVAVPQYTYQNVVHQNVRGCPPAHTRCPWLSHQYTYQHAGPWTQDAGPSRGLFGTSMCVRQYTQDVRGCPLNLLVDSSGDFGPRGRSVQYTQDIRGCPPAHAGRPRLSVRDRVCPSEHTGRPWLSISTHISTLVLGLSTLTLLVDCSGDFGPRGLSVQYTHDHTHDVRGCPSAHISARWSLDSARWPFLVDYSGDFGPRGLSVSTHRTSLGVLQHTQDVRGCPSAHTGRPCVSVSTKRTSVAVRVCPCVSISTHRTSVAVHQYTYQHVVHQNVRGSPPAHKGRLWLSVCVRQHTQDVRGCPISTHISTLVLGLSTLALPVDCSGDFGPHGLSVQYTQDVRVCPSVHTGCPWLSVCVRVCLSAHTERPWLSISTHISTLVLGLSTQTLLVDSLGDFGPRGLSVQYTQDVRGCLPAHTRCPWLSVCDRVCPSAHTGRLCLSIIHTRRLWVSASTNRTFVAVKMCPCVSVSTHMTSVDVHQYTYQHAGPWTQHAGPFLWTVREILAHVGCLFSTHRTSVGVLQHTQDVRGCPSAHTGRPCVSVSTQRTSVAVRVCLCVSISTHRTSVAVHQYTYQHVGPWTQHTDPSSGLFWFFWPTWAVCLVHQNVRRCPPAHTGRPWLSVCVRVCPPAHTRCPWLSHQYTYQHAGPWTQHAGPSRGLFGTSVGVRQYTQDVRGCPCVSMCVRQHTQNVRGCPSVHISARCTHRTSVGVRQHTQDVRGCPCVTVCVRQHTQDVRGCPSEHISARCTHRTSVGVRQHTPDVCGCPYVSVCVRQHTLDVCGCPSVHISARWSLDSARWPFLVDYSGDFSPRTLSVQYTQDVYGCPSAHTRRLWVSVSTHRTYVAVRVFPSAHTGRPWLSVCVCKHTQDVRGCPSVHISALQYTQDVRGCPPAHIGRLWLSLCVRVCPCVSVSTHRTSVAVHQYTYQHGGPWTQHACPSRGLFGTSVGVRVCPSSHTGRQWLSICTHISMLVLGLSTLTLPVDCSGDFGPRGLSVQYTRTSVGVRQHTQDVRGCPTLALSVDCSGDFGPRGLSVQYTHDVRGCPLAHTGRPCVTVSTHRTSVAVRVCPSAHTERPWLSIITHIITLVLGLSTLTLLVDCLGDFGPRGLSVQYTQDVRGCPPAHTGSPRLSVCVRVCPSAHTGRPWLSISTYISTLVLGLSTLTLPVDCLGDFGPRGLSVQYTQDIHGWPPAHKGRQCLSVMLALPVDCSGDFGPRGLSVQYTPDVHGCPSAHTGRPCVSVCVHQHTHDVCGCLRLSVCVRVYPSAHTGRPWLSSTHISTLVLGLSTPALPVDCSGDFGPRGLSGQYTQDVRGCPSAHTGGLCVSVSTQRTSVAVRVCPSAHTGRPWLSISTHISMLVLGLSTLTLPVDCSGDFGPCWLSVQYTRTSVGVRQHTQDVRGCPCVSVYVRQHTQDVLELSTLVLELSTLALRVDCSGDFGLRGLSVQYTQDVRGTSVAVHQYTYQHGGPWTQHACPSRGLFGLFWPTWAVCSVHTGRPWVSVSTHRTSVGVRVCPSAHTGRQWLSICTHISMLVLGLSTLTLPVDCSGDFGPRGLSVQYTRTSVGVRQHTQDVRGCPTLALPVDCSGDFGPRGLSVQYTHDVRGCPLAHTGRPCVSVSTHRTSVAVRVCPSAHTERPWLSIITHISTLVLGLSTLTLLVDCSGDFGPRGLSVQYTQDVRGCPPAHTGSPRLSVCVRVCPSAHTGRPWLSIIHTGHPWVAASTQRTSVPVRVSPCVSVSTHKTSVAVHQYTYQHAGPWT
ncbi:hypothetical protein YC2023_066020 [Brassica napus]